MFHGLRRKCCQHPRYLGSGGTIEYIYKPDFALGYNDWLAIGAHTHPLNSRQRQKKADIPEFWSRTWANRQVQPWLQLKFYTRMPYIRIVKGTSSVQGNYLYYISDVMIITHFAVVLLCVDKKHYSFVDRYGISVYLSISYSHVHMTSQNITCVDKKHYTLYPRISYQ